MKAVVFQEDAETEMLEAAAYYEAQQSDLGRRFLARCKTPSIVSY